MHGVHDEPAQYFWPPDGPSPIFRGPFFILTVTFSTRRFLADIKPNAIRGAKYACLRSDDTRGPDDTRSSPFPVRSRRSYAFAVLSDAFLDGVFGTRRPRRRVYIRVVRSETKYVRAFKMCALSTLSGENGNTAAVRGSTRDDVRDNFGNPSPVTWSRTKLSEAR